MNHSAQLNRLVLRCKQFLEIRAKLGESGRYPRPARPLTPALCPPAGAREKSLNCG